MRVRVLKKNVLPFIFVTVFIISQTISSIWADEHRTKKATDNKTEEKAVDEQEEKISETIHTINLNGKKYTYRAIAGEIIIQKENTAEKGRLFYVAYHLQDQKASKRPITFAFNGGPGSSSVWLHLGALGPKRVKLADDGRTLPPPVEYADNPYSWLIFTDLVFVDPIGTGFSRSLPSDENAKKQFYGVKQDIESVAEFIRLYLTRNKRWTSPTFLVGESYGTTRVAGLTTHLLQRYGIDLNGIVLISPALDFDTITFHPSNDLPYLLFLPTYTATAWHYKLLPNTLQRKNLGGLLDDVESFCVNKYSVLLAKGEDLSAEERTILLEKLSAYSGLAKDIIQENNFRIDWIDFTKNLLKEEKKLVGRMDSTITGIQVDPSKHYPIYDPSLDTLYGSFASAMNQYVREDLGYESDLVYEFLNSEVNKEWDWSSGLHGGQGFIDVSHNLREALTINDNLQVFIASGYYDLATPYFATQYTLNHLWLGDQRSNITTRNYGSGHMMYTHLEEHNNLFQDVKTFYRDSLNETEKKAE